MSLVNRYVPLKGYRAGKNQKKKTFRQVSKEIEDMLLKKKKAKTREEARDLARRILLGESGPSDEDECGDENEDDDEDGGCSAWE